MKRRALGLLLGCLAACGALRENPLDGDDRADAEVPDAREPDPDDRDGTPPRDAAPDAPTPPIRADIACTGDNAWSDVERSAECEARTVRVVQPIPPDVVTAQGHLDIAWSLSGRAAIVIPWLASAEMGYLQALSFDTASEGFIVRQDTVASDGQYDIQGESARVIARADDSFEVLSLHDDSGRGGDVELRRLPRQQPFSPPTLVFAGVEERPFLAMALQANGMLVVTATLPSGDDRAIVTKRRQPQNTEFDPPLSATFSYFEQGPLSNGNHQLALDNLGEVHIAYERGFSATRSQPRYSQLVGTIWDFLRTVDNNTLEGPSGQSLSLFMLNDEKNVVYLAHDQNDGGASPAKLIRARWRGGNDVIEKTVLLDDFRVNEVQVAASIEGSAAAAADASGAFHAVVSRQLPDDDGFTCELLYLHEATRDGSIEMLTDTIERSVPCSGPVPVAIAVEPTGRPHIAYYVVGKGVLYATRYDR